ENCFVEVPVAWIRGRLSALNVGGGKSRRGIDPNRVAIDFHLLPARHSIIGSRIESQLGPSLNCATKQDDGGTTQEHETSIHTSSCQSAICVHILLNERHTQNVTIIFSHSKRKKTTSNPFPSE